MRHRPFLSHRPHRPSRPSRPSRRHHLRLSVVAACGGGECVVAAVPSAVFQPGESPDGAAFG